jgi:NAD(P)-dependent dehydrogenase (short-subunit alcohol dehydrogenase family)
VIGSFDRMGFRRHSRAFRPGDLDVDLSGRLCLVTGGNAGLGRATAEALAKRSATVQLLCRDPGRAEAARDEIRHATGNSRVDFATLDVSDLGSVRRYIANAGLEKVHVLVHNAGVLPSSRILTADGLELTFATHVVGPHVLTNLLCTALRAAGDARVIFVSSGGMYTQRLALEDLRWDRRVYDGVVAYAQTKRMQVVLAKKWAQAFAGAGVAVYAMHPGWADTSGVKTSLPRFYKITRRFLRSPAEGADTVVWLAACQPAPTPSGGFWFDRKPRGSYYLPWTREDQATRDGFWEQCQRVAGLKGSDG